VTRTAVTGWRWAGHLDALALVLERDAKASIEWDIGVEVADGVRF
jgi:hypothetical protein